MDILLDRVMYLCKTHNISIKKLEESTRLSKSSINKWDKSIPSGDKIQKVADYFDVSIDYLMGRTDNMNSHKSLGEVVCERELKNLMEIKTIVDQKVENAKANERLS